VAVNAYQNFDLLITRSGADYRAFVVDAPGGDADATFALPFTADELDFLGNLAGARRGSRPATGGAVADLKELGGLLYGAIFQGKMAAVLATSLEKAEQEQIGLRLRLRFSEETSELATLPWEILYDPVQERFLALSASSPILRYLSLPKARPTLLVKPPLRVLAVLVSPPGYETLDVAREWQVLETALAALVIDGKFVLERLERPTFAALQERLLGDDLHILHFVGHGVYNAAAGAGALVLADADGNAQQVSGEELATLLHNHRSLRLVYLNACEGALSSHLSVFSGVAQTLVQQGVPAAVAMQAEITDTAAIDLSRLFYTALAAGYPVDAALTQARVAIASRSAEWAIPVLFSRSPDNRLFDVVEMLPAPDCPYPGMVPFTEKQADVFFGRDKEIADGVDRLRQHPFLTVIGPSGSGKSSLVYAGVIPALRKSKRFGAGEWDVRVLRPGQTPLTALAEALATSPEQLVSATFTQRTLLFVDQFEELFTLAEAAQTQRFLDALHALIGKPNLYILLTVRADFYPDLMACSLWQPIRANRLELTPLGDEELRAAILQPAAQVGVTIDEVLVERLVADAAGESGTLPLVQETLVLLWEKVERRHLALQAYVEMAEGNRNGLQVAIDRRATVVYNNLPGNSKPIARRIFLRLIQFGEGRADTRRQQMVADLQASGDDPALFDRTLATLIASRLLTTSGEEGSARRVDVSHEALIGGWATLQRWIGEKREAERTRRRLEEKAGEWVRLEKSGGLLDEYEVQEAEVWLRSDYSGDLGYSQALLDLVTASRTALAQVTAEKAASERTRQRSRIFAGGLALALVVIVLVGGFWWQAIQSRGIAVSAQVEAEISAKNAKVAEAKANAARDEATIARENTEQQRRITLSNQLAADSIISLEIDGISDRALLLAVEAISTTRGIDGIRVIAAEEALHRALSTISADPLYLYGQSSDISALAFSLDGESLGLTVGDTVEMWDVNQIESGITLPITYTRVVAAELFYEAAYVQPRGTSLNSPDKHWLAIASDNNFISLKNLQSSEDPSILFGHEDDVQTMLFTPDSQQLISASADYTVRIWNLTEPAVKSTVLRGHTAAVTALSLSPDGMRLATGSADTTVRIWDLLKQTEQPLILRDQTSEILDLAYSPDGKWLAALGRDGKVTVWRDDVDLLVQAACRVSTRNLTAQEWQQSLAGVPYQKSCSQIPYPEIAGQYKNVKIIDTFLVVGRELNQDGWQLLEKAGLFDLLFDPSSVYDGPSLDQLPNLSGMERESISRNLVNFGPSTRLLGKSSYLWQRPELFSVPLAPPDTELITIDLPLDPLDRQVVETWNNSGGLFAAIAAELEVDIDVVVGIFLTEAGTNTSNTRLLIRFENHIFYEMWGKHHKDIFDEHFSFNPTQTWRDHMWRPNADQDWQTFHNNQTSEWTVLEFARKLDEEAALSSISMGTSNIMGFNYAQLGFSDVHAMFSVFLSPNAKDRISIFPPFDFARATGKLKALRERDLVTFAKAYNGPGQPDVYADIINQRIATFNSMRFGGIPALSSALPRATPVILSELDIKLSKPFDGEYQITQYFGDNPEFYAQFIYDGMPLQGFNGLDFALFIGTPVKATDDGVVARVDFVPTFGNYVLLTHEWGESLYSTLEEPVVTVGEEVSRGQEIGISGNSGTSTGPHLGFYIRINPYDRSDGWGGFSDPLPYLEE